MMEELTRLRRRLTFWYVGVFASVLLVFGAALFLVLSRQISARLDNSLAAAADVLERAVADRDVAAGPPHGLRIPGRRLYVFDGDGLTYPDSADDWVRGLADRARSEGSLLARRELPDETVQRVLARRVATPGGPSRVLVVVAGTAELEDEYRGLLLAFVLAALGALAAVGVGGWFLTGRAAAPIRDAFERMQHFMADAAHELRTPVAVIGGHAEVALRRPRDAEDYVAALSAVHAEAVRLGGILENVMTIARADAASWPVHREPLFLDDVLLDMAGNASALATDKSVTLDVSALEELPVEGDPDLLRQLVMILIDNAVKYSPPGGRVSLAARRRDGRAELVVEDRGPGVDPDVLPHVFERFYRGDAARERATGAGLGLTIARWIVDVHGGTIVLEPGDGRGARAVVDLPLEEES